MRIPAKLIFDTLDPLKLNQSDQLPTHAMQLFHKIINFCIAAVWLINGLYCKVLGNVPRHEEIVNAISQTNSAHALTMVIGYLEILMAIWVLSGFKRKFNALLQIALILSMNLLEFALVPELLLWGKLNIVFALLFCMLIYFNTFVFYKKKHV